MERLATSTRLRLIVEPDAPTVDAEVRIRLTGAPPHAIATLGGRMVDSWGRPLSAEARFEADGLGTVDLATHAPITGTYAGVDPMGLVWSMRPSGPPTAAPATNGTLPPVALTITAEVEGASAGEPALTATVERLRLPPGVRRGVVREHGLVGVHFHPDDGPRPGIILLGGSEGGLHDLDASLLAGHGFSVLALAYFGTSGVPPHLAEIDLCYFERAIAYLQSHPSVRGQRLGVTGGSRGGEAALLIGARFQQIGAVVSVVGSGLVTQGIGPGRHLFEILRRPVASWRADGALLPYLPSAVTAEMERQVANGEPVELGLAFLPGLEEPRTVSGATIRVERIRGGVLLLSAEDDRMWPCARLSQPAIERLDRHRHPFPYRHVVYPGAGHLMVGPPHVPTTDAVVPGPGVTFKVGGTPAATAAAKADAWRQTIDFFAEQLA